ncbi:unnamed protein product [Adineta ricciae]|uniref:Uncharacterized protein n=1 Tax=Adineta ricciae TaxID=249248 RepID=A0A816BTH4_ADIRI|nr:unnamed protein product [Adineta ricciae]
MNIHLDESSCQIIAETAAMLAHFDICFRRKDPNLVVGAYDNLGRGVERFLKSIVSNYQTNSSSYLKLIISCKSCYCC